MHQRGVLVTSSGPHFVVEDFVKCMCEGSSLKVLPSYLEKSLCMLKTYGPLEKPVCDSTSMVQITQELIKARVKQFFSLLSTDRTKAHRYEKRQQLIYVVS